MAQVLVVEDDPDLADVLAYAVRRLGHAAILARDGVEALDQWRTAAPDLVLLDLHLPRVDGFAVCRAIRAAGRTPILCLSGLADAQTRHHALALGADAFLLKPFSVAQLYAGIRALLPGPPPP